MNTDETEKFVSDIKGDLLEINELPVSDHGVRYEQLHRNLEVALSTIDGL